MVLLNLSEEQARFLRLGLIIGIRGLDQETYPPFIDNLEAIGAKLEKQGFTEDNCGVQ